MTAAFDEALEVSAREVPAAAPSHVRLVPSERISYEKARARRKHEVRARTISVKRMTRRELEEGRALYPEDTKSQRPKTRAECIDGPRPCPFVSCAHHLYIDVSERTGAIKLNRPELEVWEMDESCALDAADRGGMTLEEVGAIMNVTRERVRQIEVIALAHLEDSATLSELARGGPDGRRRLPVLP